MTHELKTGDVIAIRQRCVELYRIAQNRLVSLGGKNQGFNATRYADAVTVKYGDNITLDGNRGHIAKSAILMGPRLILDAPGDQQRKPETIR